MMKTFAKKCVVSVNPNALRKNKTVYNFGLPNCTRVNNINFHIKSDYTLVKSELIL